MELHEKRPQELLLGQSLEDPLPELVKIISKELGISRTVASILAMRGLESVESAYDFINPTLQRGMPSPALLKNAELAALRILQATEKREKIAIYTDFDVDGITAGSQLLLYLKEIGSDVLCYTPHRIEEGYGLNVDAVEALANKEISLLITADCGISDVVAVSRAKDKGFDVIIVDHHKALKEIPPADVIINPTLGNCAFQDHELAAAGLCWMLLAVITKVGKDAAKDTKRSLKIDFPDPKKYLDLAAIGTICDMVPLRSVNRVIASRGLEILTKNPRKGITALLEESKMLNSKKLSAGHISFGIGPRINAAGRLDSPTLALQLMTTDSPEEAKKLAKKLNSLNSKRKKVEDQMKKCSEKIINSKSNPENHFAFAIYDDSFHVGVIGIVAQRIVEKFHRPAAVMAPTCGIIDGKEVTIIKGSVRSISGFHVALSLQKLSRFLINCGGHEAAGGFSLIPENLDQFCEAFCKEARQNLSEENLGRKIKADVEVGFCEINYDLVNEIEKLSPFGVGNPSPVLFSRNVLIERVSPLGDRHIKAHLRQGPCVIPAVGWGMLGNELLFQGKRLDIAFSPEINSWKGLSSVQLIIKAMWENTNSKC